MTSRIHRQLTAAVALCLVHLAFVAPTLGVERHDHAAAIRAPWTAEPAESDAEPTSHVSAAMAEIPLRFEPNVGQTDGQVAFVARGAGYGAFLTHEDLVLSLPRSTHAAEAGKTDIDIDTAPFRLRRAETEALAPAVVRMRLTGADMSRPVGELPIETKTNYFIGDDPAGWHTDVPNFARVRYTDVYPGVDLVFYGDGGGLEYDVVVAPGADPSALTIDWEGAETVATDATGALVLTVDGGELRMMAPVVYQEAEEGRTPVAGAFEPLGGGRVGLSLGAYDPAKPLVIDPVLVYSTFLGGASDDNGNAIAVGADGAAYVAGSTTSNNFPAAGGPSPSGAPLGDDSQVIVTKLSRTGSALIYSTFIGGNHIDNCLGLAVDSSGAAFLAGETRSTDFPTVHAFDTTFNSPSNHTTSDAFVAKLSASGNALIYSTYLGGADEDRANAIVVDSEGVAYVSGVTVSTNFPVVNAHAPRNAGGTDAFVAKLSPVGVTNTVVLAYSTYLGGGADDSAEDIAVDVSGSVYVSGFTYSADFPLSRALDTSLGGSVDGFVSKLSADGAGLLFSTYLGGSKLEYAYGVALDGDEAIYVTGWTQSADFPTTHGAYQPTHATPNATCFVTKLQRGSVLGPAYTLGWSTYLGGTHFDGVMDIAVISSGAVYVTGYTVSSDFPMASPCDATYQGQFEAFVTKLQAGGGTLAYSTYLGGSESDVALSIAVDASGNAYVCGITGSTDFPTVGAYDPTYNGGVVCDAFVAKLQ